MVNPSLILSWPYEILSNPCWLPKFHLELPASDSVGSIINECGTGQDMVGAWKP